MAMSRVSRLTFAASIVLSGFVIGYVHIKQSTDKEKLHEGVLKDIERTKKRKLENARKLQMQSDHPEQLHPDIENYMKT